MNKPGENTHHLSEDERQRKLKTLTRGAPSETRDIANAVVLKREDLFFLTQRDGCIPLSPDHGFGLYYRDCRYLDGYQLQIADTSLESLVVNAREGYTAVFELTNPDLPLEQGLLPRQQISVTWRRLLSPASKALHDVVSFRNFARETITLPVSFRFAARFEDVFVVRGLLETHGGELHAPRWEGNEFRARYLGEDGVTRSLAIGLVPAPEECEGDEARFLLRLGSRERAEIRISIGLAESERGAEAEVPPSPDLDHAYAGMHRKSEASLSGHTELRTDSLLLQGVIDRALRDLYILRSRLSGQDYFAAGVPWFVTLFGRDSLITALQTLPYEPRLAEETLLLLAKHQGRNENAWCDEQPGKILHEFRFGELARAGIIPHTPYYGSIDSTPLFLITLARHAAWTGELRLFERLRDNVERALRWIKEHGDLDGDGYLEYASEMDGAGLINQGWKDSGDAIVNADGTLADPPIALVEVQAYVYLAYRELAPLFRRAGEPGRAEEIEREAERLQKRFNRDFWLDTEGHYCLALQAGNRPAAVLTSNAGHALWAGIADAAKAEKTVHSLMREDMFSGWGVRTLSDREQRYNPIGYHLGTVWPHDNAIIAAGLRRYGFDDQANRIATGIIEAATRFHIFRLPELFSGFRRADYGVPVNYPVANHPQAWSAGAIPYLLQILLGLVPDGFNHRLRIVRPMLPDFADSLELRHLRVGQGAVDLRFERHERRVRAQVLRTRGPLEVSMAGDEAVTL